MCTTLRDAVAALLSIAIGCGVSVGFAANPDSNYYVTYVLGGHGQWAYMYPCGSSTVSHGCYGVRILGPFGHIGAMLEGRPHSDDDEGAPGSGTVTREIYVVDVASGSTANGVSLFVYKRTDAVTANFDDITVSLDRTISLPLVGGTNASVSMAENNAFLYVGTNQGTQAVSIDRRNWAILPYTSGEPAIPVAAITANSYGYVTVTFADVVGNQGAFIVFDPKGAPISDGGGADFMLDDINAVTPAGLP